MKWLIPGCLLISLVGCGGGSDDSSSATDGGSGDNNGGGTPPASLQAPDVEVGENLISWNHQDISISAQVTLYAEGNAKYLWHVVSGPQITLSGANTSTVSIDASSLQLDTDLVFDLQLTVTDAAGKTSQDSLTITLKDQITAAIKIGDPALIDGLQDRVITRALNIIQQYRDDNAAMLASVYQGNDIVYDSGQHSQMIRLNQAVHSYPQVKSFELIRGNGGRIFAAASDKSGQRNAAFGTDIISSMQQGNNLAYQQNFKQLLSWLLDKEQSQDQAEDVRLFLMAGNTVNRITSWISTQYPNWSVTLCDDEATQTSCLEAGNLIITGSSGGLSEQSVSSLLMSAQLQGTPLLYMHLHSWNSVPLTQTVLNLMDFSMQGAGGPGNFFSPDKASWSNYTEMLTAKPSLTADHLWLSLFDSQNPGFNLARCADKCDALFDEQYKPALSHIRAQLQSLDAQHLDMFEQEDHRLYKLLTLLGDSYRSQLKYPMDVTTTDDMDFLKAMFADNTVYHYRNINPVPNDLGNFSRSDFSHITPTNKSVTLSSKKGFRSAGVYALPGQTVTVSRTDSNDVRSWIFINTQRSGSTHEFDNQGYNRAKYLQSTHIELKPGQSIKFTSPYGGPMQVKFDKSDIETKLSFSHIGLHPYWREGMDGAQFMQQLTLAKFDWAELATPHFEVHSRLDKMQATMSHEALWDTPEKMGQAIMTHVHNYPHVLAGFKGPFIDEVSEITDFAVAQGWEIDNLDTVKHMNADQATCGSGCSGNPYDASWSFSPTGHGDIHELGHGLEKGRLRFDGHEGHASTNPYSYYTKSRAYKESGKLPSCQGLSIEDEFEVLQASMRQADPFKYMQDAKLTSWSNGMATMLQMMVAAQKYGALEDGWHLLARLHILLREFERAKANEDIWLEKRASIGFSGYSLDTAKAISNNDFLLIAMSYSTRLDYRDLYQMWGLATTQGANDQVAGFNYTSIARQVYVYAPGDYCLGLDLQAVAVDGNQTWPLN